MRPIKFRAWDVVEHKYYKNVQNSENCETNRFWSFNQVLEEAYDRKLIVEQFTGLIDDNGVEVYENDIVETNIMGKNHRTYSQVIEYDGKNSLARDAGLAINIDANTRNIHIIAKALNIDKYTERRQEKASDAINLTAEDTQSGDWPTASTRDVDAEKHG